MFQFDLDHAVAAIVEAMLPRFSPADEGLLITLDLRLHTYTDDEEKRASRIARLLFVRPNNYTKVMYSTGHYLLAKVKPEDWVMTSDHDSCWRSDGFRLLEKLYFDMRDEVGFKATQHCWIDRIQRVKVELETYENKSRSAPSYRPKTIEVIKES